MPRHRKLVVMSATTAPLPGPAPRRHRNAHNAVEVLTAVLLDDRPGDAAAARRMLEQLRLGLNASIAAVWVMTDRQARRALAVGPAASRHADDALVLDDVAIMLDRLRRNATIRCRNGQVSGLEALVPDGVRAFVAAAAGRGGAIDGALILGWNTEALRTDSSVEPLLRIAAARLLHALRPIADVSPDISRSVLDSLPASVIVVDSDGVTLSINARWWESADTPLPEPDAAGPGIDFLEVCRRAAADGRADALAAVAGIEAVCAGAVNHFEHTCTWDGPGQRRHILMKVARLRRPEGGAVIVLENLTMESVENLAPGMIEDRFQCFVDSMPTPVWVVAPDGHLLYGNQAWRDATGAEASQLTWTEAVHQDDVARLAQALLDAGEQRTGFHIELRLRGHDGAYRWWAFVGAPRYGPAGTVDAYVGTCSDATARRHAQQDLRELGGRLLAAQEAQRGRIARELHDDIGQQVALLASRLNAAARTPRQSPERLRKGIDEALSSLSELATSIHNLSYELYPAKLRLLGLEQTLHALCRDIAAAARIVVTYTQDGAAPDIPENIALCVFRVGQEALQNAIKHSGARHIDVHLAVTGEHITLRATDRGSGFDPLASNGSTLGLVTMRERVELSGGQLRVETAPGQGTTIEAVIPLPHHDVS
jgi:PAS domain S-box-containing protein